MEHPGRGNGGQPPVDVFSDARRILEDGSVGHDTPTTAVPVRAPPA
ncbi:hypothetical protein ABZ318_22335 [Streptomyces sp. NPDC006197]